MAVLALPATVAAADVPSSLAIYEGRTSQNGFTSLEVHPRAHRAIQKLAVRYRSVCDDGETLRSTFRFAPIRLKGRAFSRSGTVTGTLTDGRAYRSQVRVAGRFDASRQIAGTFALSTRIPDGHGGVAACSTGSLTWRMAPPRD